VSRAAEGANAEETFDSLYGAELRKVEKTRDTADDLELAARLLEGARKADAMPGVQTLMCIKACRLAAADPKGFETALAAADLLADKAPALVHETEETVLAIRKKQYDASPAEWKAAAGEVYVQCLAVAAAGKARTGNIEEALSLCRMASRIARDIRLANTEAVDAQIKRLTEMQKIVGRVPQLKAQLKADPANRKAREELLRLYVVELDNPAEAEAFLDDQSDPAYRKYVPAAAKPVDAAPEEACRELGDWYRELAASATALGQASTLARARAYYERFLQQHAAKDEGRAKVELALDSVRANLKKLDPGTTAYVPTFGSGQWIDLVKLVDPGKDALAGQWERAEAGLKYRGSDEPRLVMPLLLAGDYELEFSFVWGGGDPNGVYVFLPVGKSDVRLIVHYDSSIKYEPERRTFRAQLYKAASKAAAKGDTGTYPIVGVLETKKAYTVRIRVQTAKDQAMLTVAIEGKPCLQWTGPQSALSTDDVIKLPHAIVLGTHCMNAYFPGVRLRMLTGKAVPMPRSEATAPQPKK
jgi:hypothetical protein